MNQLRVNYIQLFSSTTHTQQAHLGTINFNGLGCGIEVGHCLTPIPTEWHLHWASIQYDKRLLNLYKVII